jgi:hypothetical protein
LICHFTGKILPFSPSAALTKIICQPPPRQIPPSKTDGWSQDSSSPSMPPAARLRPKAGVTLNFALVNNNVFSTAQNKPLGIWLVGPSTKPEDGFINNLTVDSNQFRCGFADLFTPPGSPPPPNAYVRPSGQGHTGNIGFAIACP